MPLRPSGSHVQTHFKSASLENIGFFGAGEFDFAVLAPKTLISPHGFKPLATCRALRILSLHFRSKLKHVDFLQIHGHWPAVRGFANRSINLDFVADALVRTF